MNRSSMGPALRAGLLLAACCCAAPWSTAQTTGLFARRPVAAAELGKQRALGNAGESELLGTVSDNVATQVTTGSNQITGGAFAGMSGVPVVIQNTGNNVLIQSSTVINVQLK